MEDNDDDVDLARLALARSGRPHVLEVARDGAEAVARLADERARHALPAFVVLDWNLPKVAGRNVLREIRGNPWTSRVPVVVYSTSRLEQDVLDAYVMGGNSYIRKSVDFGNFTRHVSLLLEYWLGINLPPHVERAPYGRAGATTGPGPDAPIWECRGVSARADRRYEVMVIDSHEQDRLLTCGALSPVVAPQEIAEMCTYGDAVRYFAEVGGPPPHLSPNAPWLLVVETDLADGDGHNLLQALRYRFDHFGVTVVLTRDASPGFVSECYRLKVNGVVRKPDDPVEYARVVRTLGEYWFGVNERPPAPTKTIRASAHPG
ncbi:MAG: response regulator [Myxococcota bacterium]